MSSSQTSMMPTIVNVKTCHSCVFLPLHQISPIAHYKVLIADTAKQILSHYSIWFAILC